VPVLCRWPHNPIHQGIQERDDDGVIRGQGQVTQGAGAFRALYQRLRKGGHGTARTFAEENPAGPPDWGRVRQMARFFGALGDPECIRLLEFLAGGERTIPECIAYTRRPAAEVSDHMSTLQERGWIQRRRRSYGLADARVRELVLLARVLAENNVGALVHCSHLESSPPC
jgi:hypothetical protein